MTRSPQSKHLVCLPGGNKTPKRSPFPIPKPPEKAIAKQDTFAVDLQQLESQARRINQLSAELEVAIAEFKESGDRVDRGSVHFREKLGHDWFPDRVCSYGEIKVPRIHQNAKGALILSSHRVNLFEAQLFEAQKEAHFVAHLLRQRNIAKQ